MPTPHLTPSLQVFYDGACPLCNREMALYQRRDRQHQIAWIDIAAPDFSAAHYHLNPARLQEVMHARTPDGQIFTEVAAFLKIWQTLPPRPFTSLLRLLLKLPGLLPLAGILYRLFARNRHRLTGRCTPKTCPINSPEPLTHAPPPPSSTAQTSSTR